jgi:chitin synthase
MFTSFIQYLLLTPTYINILNVYAFCNTHDITWGTKGDDKAEKLPSATLKPGGKVDVNIPSDDADLNTQYENEIRALSVKAPKEVKVASPSEKQEDYYKGFRSAVVLVWMFCNFALAAVVLSTGGLDRVSVKGKESETQRSTIYMAVVLWSVAGLSLFRFIGAMWFLVVRMVSLVSDDRLSLPRQLTLWGSTVSGSLSDLVILLLVPLLPRLQQHTSAGGSRPGRLLSERTFT